MSHPGAQSQDQKPDSGQAQHICLQTHQGPFQVPRPRCRGRRAFQPGKVETQYFSGNELGSEAPMRIWGAKLNLARSW